MGIFDFLFKKKENQVADYIAKGAILLDVRTDKEYHSGSIKGAKHIPLDQLRNRIDEIKSLKKPVIVFCASGVRSAKAAKYLNLENIDAINGGGIRALKRLL